MSEQVEAGWQPISSAPKDGEDVLLTDGTVVTFGGWISDVDQGADYEGQCGLAGWWSLRSDDGFEPTHWMPLPAPPQPEP
jgi:hypothetical protein